MPTDGSCALAYQVEQDISQLGKKHSAAFLPPPPLSSSTEHSDQGWILEGARQLQPGAQLLAELPC